MLPIPSHRQGVDEFDFELVSLGYNLTYFVLTNLLSTDNDLFTIPSTEYGGLIQGEDEEASGVHHQHHVDHGGEYIPGELCSQQASDMAAESATHAA
ncbi:unnamed protein product [Leptidea sinapis]|uniref:Uncharacterized protein n=1 Tax=Leptidea sinapis TaxID=189913 RepID=A0A5E4R4D1_9NEOP|nr:unnamed protein product [Leptidea sinapis]